MAPGLSDACLYVFDKHHQPDNAMSSVAPVRDPIRAMSSAVVPVHAHVHQTLRTQEDPPSSDIHTLIGF